MATVSNIRVAVRLRPVLPEELEQAAGGNLKCLPDECAVRYVVLC